MPETRQPRLVRVILPLRTRRVLVAGVRLLYSALEAIKLR
jgi:hypothetical protein